MSNEDRYKYYRVEGPAVKALIDSHTALQNKRNEVLQKLLDDTGAVGYTSSSCFGGQSSVGTLAFLSDHQFPCQVKVIRKDTFEGKPVVIVKGDGRTKEGRAFSKTMNDAIHQANSQIKDVPNIKPFLIDHYKISVITPGRFAPHQRGFPMLYTYGGLEPNRDDSLLFAIPQYSESEQERSKQPAVPDGFTEITYGQFYDAAK